MCHFVRGTYAKVRHYASSTCHPRRMPCMQEHNTCITHKTHQNPRPVFSKPRHSSVGLTKPRANTSLVQGSTNPRFTLGIQVHQKPKVRPWYTFLQNPRSALGAYFYKTQGTPLVCSLVATTMTTVQGPSSSRQTTTTLFGKTFNQIKVMLTPHNHQRSSFVSQDDPPLDCMTRPSIKCNLYSFLITIRERTLQVKQCTPWLVGKTFNRDKSNILLTTIRGEAPQNT